VNDRDENRAKLKPLRDPMLEALRDLNRLYENQYRRLDPHNDFLPEPNEQVAPLAIIVYRIPKIRRQLKKVRREAKKLLNQGLDASN